MPSIGSLKWSKNEKAIARRAFDCAYERECAAIFTKFQEMIAESQEPDQLWKILQYLQRQEKQMYGKYDFRYSVIMYELARLVYCKKKR